LPPGIERSGLSASGVVPDLAGYERLLLETLLKLPGVSDIRSNFSIQTHSSLPLCHLTTIECER
jgi:Lrp/AsnC family leucine-responsive transcriptional regulator